MNILQNKLVVGFVAIVVVGLLAYNFLSNVVVPEPSSETVGADLIKMSQEISQATLGQELFDKPGYVRLTDYSITLVPEPLGRSNPFNTIGRD